jgi:hypothetical protein
MNDEHRHFDYDAELSRAINEDRTRHSWSLLSIARSLESLAATSSESAKCVCDLHSELRNIAQSLDAIRDILKPKFPVRGIFTQGASMPVTGTILGLVPGASDNFFVTPIDVNGNADQLPAGSPVPTITADDPAVTVATAADGLSAQVTAPAAATPGGSFNLNWAATYTKPDGTTASITATANVPYLAPPALLPVGGVISQGTPAAAKRK